MGSQANQAALDGKADKEDAIKVISHSYLNIENELDVALLALDWIKENDQVKSNSNI